MARREPGTVPGVARGSGCGSCQYPACWSFVVDDSQYLTTDPSSLMTHACSQQKDCYVAVIAAAMSCPGR